ncbi:MAG: archaeosortase/exosortase family protein [Saprospiraceae bacterium]
MSRQQKKPSKQKQNNHKIKSRLVSWWDDQSIALRFLGLFALLLGLFYAFYYSNFNLKNIHPSILNAQAKLGSFLVNLFGQSTYADNQYIGGDGFNMSVSGGCDGLEVTALLVSGILAFPSTWKEKWKGLLYGGSILTVLNILRLPMLYFAGAKGSQALFDFLHVQGGFVIFISITMFIWGYWVIQVLNHRKTASVPSTTNTTDT